MYDIFSGSEKSPLWLETVEDLDLAIEKMKGLASETPGTYFVYCLRMQRVLASVDTSCDDATSDRWQAKV